MKHNLISFAAAAILCLPAVCAAQTPPVYTITTVAGNNTAGFAGDGAAATAAELDGPTSVWIDSKGNIYIADSFNNRIRMVSASNGNISTVAGNGTPGFAGDTLAATNAATAINGPDAVIVDSKGNIYIADTANDEIRLVNTSGIISTYAGDWTVGAGFSGDGGQANVAQLAGPGGVTLDSSGNLYIADTKNNRIRKVIGSGSSAGVISTIINQNGNPGFLNGTTPLASHLNLPRGLAIDANGALYIADTASNEIRKYAAGVVTSVAGNALGLAGHGGDGGSATGTSAYLHSPSGVAVDTCGNLYIADTTNDVIRMVTSDGNIHTIAGIYNSLGFSGDGGPALSAQLNFPAGLTVDSKGNVYVADTDNAVIRKLTPASAVPCGNALPVVSAGGVISAGAFGAFSSMAPGSWIEIYGSNLAADARPWTAADFSNNGTTAPTSLDRTTVTINGQSAFIDYISSGQVNAQVPANTGTGPLQLTVSTAAGSSAPVNITMNTVQPGLWAPPQFNIGGKQYAGATFTDGVTFVAPPGAIPGFTSRQAKPGDTIILYGIGFGTVNTGVQPGQVVEQSNFLVQPIQFNFGSTPAAVPVYFGLAGNFVGLYEFYVTVPNVPNSDLVPLTFTLGTGQTAVNSTQTLYTAVHN